jgi:hypothetical protein
MIAAPIHGHAPHSGQCGHTRQTCSYVVPKCTSTLAQKHAEAPCPCMQGCARMLCILQSQVSLHTAPTGIKPKMIGHSKQIHTAGIYKVQSDNNTDISRAHLLVIHSGGRLVEQHARCHHRACLPAAVAPDQPMHQAAQQIIVQVYTQHAPGVYANKDMHTMLRTSASNGLNTNLCCSIHGQASMVCSSINADHPAHTC